MKPGRVFLSAALSLLAVGSPAFADVQIAMQNGRVSVVAKDATLRQILTEWARVGQTKVVNVERVPGAPMTIELRDVPEAQALEILLRSLSGYMAAPRAIPAPTLSRFDRIVVMPTIAAARQAVAAAAATPSTPVFQSTMTMPPPPPPQPPEPADPDDERQGGAGQNPGAQRPVFSAFPQPQAVAPSAAAPVPTQQPGYTPPPGMQMPNQQPVQTNFPQPGAFPTAAPGVPVPGMIVPGPPIQPGQVKRPGGSDRN